jgi:predicted signal transduction protein with EAL and GGDEF domain
MMRALGCNSMQGYFFSRPVPTPQVDELVEAFNGRREVEGDAWSGRPIAQKQAS